MGHTTISVSPETLTLINDAMPEEYDSKDAFLRDLIDDGEIRTGGAGGLSDAQYAELVDALDRIESSASTAETRTGSIEGMLEELSR